MEKGVPWPKEPEWERYATYAVPAGICSCTYAVSSCFLLASSPVPPEARQQELTYIPSLIDPLPTDGLDQIPAKYLPINGPISSDTHTRP